MEYSLNKGKAMSLSTGQAKYLLRVSTGIVWLTCPDDSRDYFLGIGESFDTRTEGRFVLEAMVDSTIDIDCRNADTVVQLLIQVKLEPSWSFPVTFGRISRTI
jgi:hypothetical protein